MMAVVTTGNGGYDKLVYRAVPTPQPGPGEVLLRVLAAGVNNTEINTRLGWYSSSVTADTAGTANESKGSSTQTTDGGWNATTPFPLIQGTDCCGRVLALGAGVDPNKLGSRVLVRACMRPHGFAKMDNIWMASDFDGAFAEYLVVPASEVFAVQCDWTDEELATIPCAYGTAENMLHRANVSDGECVLIAGASGGVGSAALQLAKRRGAKVVAITSPDKVAQLKDLGADVVLSRDANLVDVLGSQSVDVVVDNVAGPKFPEMLKVLKRGGRLVSSGAIAGPIVNLDMRDMYLKDILLIGCTAWDEPVFPNVISYIERNEIRPLLAASYPLSEIVAAQEAFMTKKHLGNMVLVPPCEK
ncbi:alcohol dehydrogenase [Sulfitobacter sp. SK012]|nr:alcohol dehydrogenase [Sulfitobacter sp. SK012]